MFTGLIERKGRVVASQQDGGIMSLVVAVDGAPSRPFEVSLGDSVAINGCCLTVTRFTETELAFDVSRETLSLTNLGALTEGSPVNLERALRLGDRLGGHLVSGHVDGAAKLAAVERRADGWHVTVALPPALARYVVPKGSICLDGVSLTVNAVKDLPGETHIHLMLIPVTVAETTFADLPIGWSLNVEVDMMGKYLERFAAFPTKV